MSPKLYGTIVSPAVRATLLAIKALGIEVEFKEVNIMAREQFKPEFLKLNPLHTVPTLEEDDGFVIWDSHAINAYLVGKYGKDDSLYPKDLLKRAIVDQRLYFDVGYLFPRFAVIAITMVREGPNAIIKEDVDSLEAAYVSLETLLDRSTYVAGNDLSIADFSIISTMSTANFLVPVSTDRFPKLTAWISKMEALPYYAEAIQKGLDLYISIVKSKSV